MSYPEDKFEKWIDLPVKFDRNATTLATITGILVEDGKTFAIIDGRYEEEVTNFSHVTVVDKQCNEIGHYALPYRKDWKVG